MSRTIYHLLPRRVWEQQSAGAPYSSDTLATEGFTHCTYEPEMLLRVANHFYRERAGDFVVLCIDESRVVPEVRWEPADGHLFPHVYGPLNLDAVVGVAPMPRAQDGSFLPPALPAEGDGAE